MSMSDWIGILCLVLCGYLIGRIHENEHLARKRRG